MVNGLLFSGGPSVSRHRRRQYHPSVTAELFRRARQAVYLLLVTVLFHRRDSIAGHDPQQAVTTSYGVDAVEDQKWQPRLVVSVEPKQSAMFSGDTVSFRCSVTAWLRTSIEQSQLRMGFFYEVEPRTSVPLTSSLPGITVRTDRYDYQYLPLDVNNSKETTSTDSIAIKLNGGSSRLGRGRRERVGFGRRVEIVRHLVVNREAYRFFHRGDNNFYCTAIDRRLGLRQTDYFSINKI